MRRAVVALAAILGGLVLLGFGPGASSAWAEGEAVRGELTQEQAGEEKPVPGVVITVSTEDGQEVGSVTTDAEGVWLVPVPAAGTYVVALDESTLPDGLVVRNGRPVLTVPVFEGSVRSALFPLGTSVEGEPGDTPDGSPGESGSNPRLVRVVSLTYEGLHFGLIIALAALGLSLIFGTMGLTNFSHGELVTFGAVMAYTFNVIFLDLPVLWAGLIAVILGGAFGWLQARFFWGWLKNRGTGLIAMMIISIGAALVLRFTFLYSIGAENHRFSQYVIQQPLEIGVLNVPPKSLIADAVALLVLIGVGVALLITRLGKAIRAVADNPPLAAASGINVDGVIRAVWAMGGALAALAGVILAIDEGASFQMGLQILLLIFAAVVLGGLGTAFGAMLGALIVGLFIQLSTLWVPTEFKYIGALGILIIILMIRPQGILGRRERVG